MLDLTKLKSLELPTAIVDIEIMGEKQAVKVTAPSDETALTIAELATLDLQGTALTLAIAKVILSDCCADITAEDADTLREKAFASAVMPIMAKARELRIEFEKRVAEITENNKKAQAQEQNGAEPATAGN